MNSIIKNFIELFNQEKFHEAHDCLEEFWKTYEGADRIYYQALIQFTVALYLQQESRFTGAQKVLARALKNMEDYHGELNFIDLNKLKTDVVAFINEPLVMPKIKVK